MIQAVPASEPTTGAKLSGLVRVPCPLCSHDKSVPEVVVAGYQLEKCCGCRFVFMNPRCTPQHLDEIYCVRDEEELIELYARIASPGVVEGYREKLIHLEQLMPSKGRMLDFACAAGYFFEEAQKRGWDAHGCDIGKWAARAAATRGLKNMHIGTLEELNFEPESFDVIYASQVFEHLLNPNEDLTKLLKLLRPGGLIYVAVPNYHTLPTMLGRDDFLLNEPPQHINYFTPATIRKMLAKAPVTGIQVTSYGGLKWENVLGQPIKSEVASAYGLGQKSKDSGKGPSGPRRFVNRIQGNLKSLAKTAVVRPFLYDGMRLGMVLSAWAFKKG